MSDVKKYYLNSLIGVAIMLGFGFIPPFGQITPYGMQMIGLFLGVVWLWSTVEIVWPSFFGLIVLAITDFGNFNAVVTAAFGNANVLVLLFIMIFTSALIQYDIVDYLGRKLVTSKFAYGKPWVLSAAFLLTSYAVTALVGNFIAVTFLLWAIFYAICESAGIEKHSPYASMMLIGIGWASVIGAILLPFHGNVIFFTSTYHGMAGSDFINDGAYLITSLVMSLLSIAGYLLAMKFVFRADVSKLKSINFEQFAVKEKLSGDQKFVLWFTIIFTLVLCLPSLLPADWSITALLNNYGVVGLAAIASCIMMFIRKSDNKPFLDFNKAISFIPWPMFFMIATALLIATNLTTANTGVTATVMQYLQPILLEMSDLVLYIAVIFVTLFLTNLANNMIIAIIMNTIIAILSIQAGVSYEFLMPIVVFAVIQGLILPASSQLGAIYHGNVEWLSPKEIYKYTATILLISFIITCVVGLPLSMLLY